MALYVHTTCLNLFEALSGHYPFYLPQTALAPLT